MKIKAKKNSIASMKLIVPIDGLITIDGNGVADVSPKCAAILVKNTDDWKFLGKESEEKEIINDPEENTVEEVNEVEQQTEDERETFVKNLKTMKITDLKEMCKDGGFPEEEWGSLTKNLLVSYLINKYDEAEKQDAEESSDDE